MGQLIFGTAQFKLHLATCASRVAREILLETCELHVSNVRTYHITCCNLLSSASPTLNPAHGPYTRYKHPNCSNYGQQTYFI